MNRPRPINLNLFTIHFPIPAIVSILHRVSGVFLLLCIPFVLWLLSYSLTSDGYDYLQQGMQNMLVKIILWACLVPFIFHLIAGIRHLLSDIHLGDTLKMGRLTAWLTCIISALLVILAGVWLW